MDEPIKVGDRVQVLLDSKFWRSRGWFEGTVVRIDAYSEHRSFYWVELDEEVRDQAGSAFQLISVLNPSNIVKR